MDAFEYNINPCRVVFGSGSLSKVAEELRRIHCNRPLVVCGPRHVGHARRIESILGQSNVAGIFSEAAMHTPVHVTERAMAVLNGSNADAIVSIGGGSPIGLGKALAIRTGLPHIAIPTTYAGSEMTPLLGETSDGKKVTRNDPKILPTTVIYDVDLTLRLPAMMSATSGVNAIAHAVEALYAPNANPITSLIALEGIKALSTSLPTLVAETSNIEARSQALYGAWLCSICGGTVSMGLHHKLCHTLGGSFGLPHSETHTNVLPHAYAYNSSRLSNDVKAKLAATLSAPEGDAVQGLNVLLDNLSVQRGLSQYGMREEDVPKAAAIAMSAPYSNPREIEQAGIEEVIRRAWAGEHARADL